MLAMQKCLPSSRTPVLQRRSTQKSDRADHRNERKLTCRSRQRSARRSRRTSLCGGCLRRGRSARRSLRRSRRRGYRRTADCRDRWCRNGERRRRDRAFLCCTSRSCRGWRGARRDVGFLSARADSREFRRVGLFGCRRLRVGRQDRLTRPGSQAARLLSGEDELVAPAFAGIPPRPNSRRHP